MNICTVCLNKDISYKSYLWKNLWWGIQVKAKSTYPQFHLQLCHKCWAWNNHTWRKHMAKSFYTLLSVEHKPPAHLFTFCSTRATCKYHHILYWRVGSYPSLNLQRFHIYKTYQFNLKQCHAMYISLLPIVCFGVTCIKCIIYSVQSGNPLLVMFLVYITCCLLVSFLMTPHLSERCRGKKKILVLFSLPYDFRQLYFEVTYENVRKMSQMSAHVTHVTTSQRLFSLTPHQCDAQSPHLQIQSTSHGVKWEIFKSHHLQFCFFTVSVPMSMTDAGLWLCLNKSSLSTINDWFYTFMEP